MTNRSHELTKLITTSTEPLEPTSNKRERAMTYKIKESIMLPEGFRFIEQGDADVPFACGDERMDKYTLLDYFLWSKEENSTVAVYEKDERITGILYLKIYPKYIFIEMIASNKLVPNKGVGTRLLAAGENIARQLRKERILLHSLDTTVQWYKMNGFQERKPARADVEFGLLYPMEKILR